MIYYVGYVKDRIGNNYLGIDIPYDIVEPYLNELKEIIGENDFEEFTNYQIQRDKGKHHMTVINVSDYNRCVDEVGMDKFINTLDEKVFKYEIDDLRMLGVGTAQRDGNRTFFVVCQSDKIKAIRQLFDLPEIDLHITIGFKFKDVFGVRKNQLMEKESKFLKLLKHEFYNTQNWNFIRQIQNFNFDKSAEIIPISIEASKMKFKCEGYYFEVVYLEDGEKFWIASKYPVEEKLPRLSETEIVRILNNKNK